MSLDRQYKKLVLQCDTCGTSAESDPGTDFNEFWATKKSDGWRAFKDDDDEWNHKCPECAR